jgi:hypothetical protein
MVEFCSYETIPNFQANSSNTKTDLKLKKNNGFKHFGIHFPMTTVRQITSG